MGVALVWGVSCAKCDVCQILKEYLLTLELILGENSTGNYIHIVNIDLLKRPEDTGF